jgi:hypothetical protein
MAIQQVFDLQIFRYEDNREVRTIELNGEIWFYATDVCKILDIKNPRDAVSKLDEDEVTTVANPDGRAGSGSQQFNVVNESGLYHLIFKSRKESAKNFRKWVTSEVIPSIRKKGGYLLPGMSATPIFIRRYNDNWNRIDKGHFSVISELTIRVYGRLEHAGHRMADHAPNGKELRPDVSVGKLFADWLRKNYPDKSNNYKMYSHLLPDGSEVEARQYPLEMFPIFITYIDEVWIPERSYEYFKTRDIKALPHLPKLLPPSAKAKEEKSFEAAVNKAIPVEGVTTNVHNN